MDNALRDFILDHAPDDTAKLLLSKAKWPDIDVDAAVTIIECRKKIRTKLPEWYAEPTVIFPDRICAEQSSSSFTASYKADAARRILELSGKCRIADLTGGLGVDSLAFSKVADNVLYNEMEQRRAETAKHNFKVLGAENIYVTSHKVTASDNDAGSFWNELRSFEPGLVYMDPARRSADGGKVFLLEDCSPNVLEILPCIFDVCDNLLLKISPMADISMAAGRLAEHCGRVKELHVVSTEGECKELLLWVTKASDNCAGGDDCTGYRLIVNENGNVIEFSSEEEKSSAPALFGNEEEFLKSGYLFEPGKSLAKAGVFNSLCGRLSVFKAGRSTHLYFSDTPSDYLSQYGKCFEILEIRPLNKQSIREFAAKYHEAGATARNIPLTSNELARRLKLSSSDRFHIFGLRMDFTDSESGNWLVAARKLAGAE